MNNIVLNKLSLLFFSIVGIALTYLFIGKLFVLFLPFILAWIFSIILQPIVNISSKYFKLPRYIISIFCVLGLISISGALIYALFNSATNLLIRLEIMEVLSFLAHWDLLLHYQMLLYLS